MSEQKTVTEPSVAAVVLRALERVASLYEMRVNAAKTYDAKLTEDGVRLAAALEKMRRSADEAASLAHGSATDQGDTAKRELLSKLELEIEATIAQRVAASFDAIPAECPKCGFRMQELAAARQSATAHGD